MIEIVDAASIVAALGVLVAVRQLTFSAQADKFSVFMQMYQRWAESEEKRRSIRYHSSIEALASEQSEVEREIARSVVDELNLAGLLLEENLIPAKPALSLMSVEVIRLVYRLESFMESETHRIGVPYGRRVIRLRDRAVRYVSIRPNLRCDIYVHSHNGDERKCAFRMDHQQWNRPLKKVERMLRNAFSIY